MTQPFDIEPLIAPVAEGSPCGENLEYDPEYQALELAVGAAEWSEVLTQGLAVAQRTRDLRVAIFISRAGLHTSGYAGFSAGLELIAQLLETHWEELHPHLEDLDEGLPPTRLNLLAALGVRDSSSLEDSMLNEIRGAELVQLPGLGKFSYRDVLIAQGDLSLAEGEEAVELATIQGALGDADKAIVQATLDAVTACLAHLVRITQSFADALGSAWAPDFQPLNETLTSVRDFISQHARLAAPAGALVEQDENTGTQTSGGAAAGPSGPIASRQDAIRVLGEVSQYFEQHDEAQGKLVPIFDAVYRRKG